MTTIEEELKNILSIEHVKPERGLEILRNDFMKRLRDRGVVNENVIKGLDLAIRIAFRLGEKHGTMTVMNDLAKAADLK